MSYDRVIGTLDGFHHFKNLNELSIESLAISDFRPLRNLTNMKRIEVVGENNISLEDFKTWTQLESFYYGQRYNQNKAALTDISALSSNPNLESIYVRTYGSLPTITLSKRHAQYELFDPIVLSSQFGENKMNYSITGYTEKESVTDEEYSEYYEQIDDEDSDAKDYSDNVSDDGLLHFENIPPFAESLNFEARIDCGSYSYRGDIKIPIRWVA